MKPFNLEAAKNGAPVCTREGNPARIICWDVADDDPIVALVKNKNGIESILSYRENGRYFYGSKSKEDLMMASTKHEGWVNLYRRDDGTINMGSYYKTEEEAKGVLPPCNYNYRTTIHIEWEE